MSPEEEIKTFHLVTLALKGEKPVRNRCRHLYVPIHHDMGMCDLNDKLCEEETYPGKCETRIKEEAEFVLDGFCPFCGTELEFFSGLENIPAYMYCPKCNDAAYDQADGKVIAKII